MDIFSSLFPIFLLTCVGVFLRQSGFLDETFFKNGTKLIYWVAMPALLFHTIATTTFDFMPSFKIFLAMFLASAGICAAAIGAGLAMRLPGVSVRTFIHASFHSNTAFVGLPVIMYVFKNGEFDTATRLAGLSLAPMIPFVNVLSILVLKAGRKDKSGGGDIMFLIKDLTKNPMILACAAGVVFAAFELKVPLSVGRGLNALGNMALPLAMLSVGASLKFQGLRGDAAASLTGAFFNSIALPALGYFFCMMLGLNKMETLIALIFLACPTAASAYIYAVNMGGDQKLAGNVILISTLMSALSLPLTLCWFS